MRRCPFSPPRHHAAARAAARALAESSFLHEHYASGGLALAADASWFLARLVIRAGLHAIQRHIDRVNRRQMDREMAGKGLPSPSELEAAWTRHPGRKRTLTEALRLGGLLLLVTSALDSSPILNDQGRMVGRRGGLKAWLAEYCPSINYTTACRYRKLASLLLQLLEIEGDNAGAAIDFVLPDGPRVRGPDAPEIRRTRDYVSALLDFHPSQRGLRGVLRNELRKAGKMA
ncbi:MAG: hypothetical protein ILO10_08600 [Kiritimatiellae bacterium]|nr:hypothetical protein [Kiritimatiellia bacterium]